MKMLPNATEYFNPILWANEQEGIFQMRHFPDLYIH